MRLILSLAAMAQLSAFADMQVSQPTETTKVTVNKELEQQIEQTLINNPGILDKALQKLLAFKEEQRQKEMAEISQKINKNAQIKQEELLNLQTGFLVGNRKSPYKLVVFYDNNCGGCRKFESIVGKLQEKYGDQLSFIFRQWAILGAPSEQTAKVMTAAAAQGYFFDGFKEIAKSTDVLDQEKAIKMFTTVDGVNIGQLKKDADSPKVAQILEANAKLAEGLGLMATPSLFLIHGDKVTMIEPEENQSFEEALDAHINPAKPDQALSTSETKKEEHKQSA